MKYQVKACDGVTNGATYGYRAQACNAGGCGPWSGVSSTQIAIPPPKPTGVYADDETINTKVETITVVWSAVSGASHYEVEDSGSGQVLTSTTSTSYVAASGTPPLTASSYAVRSCNAYACSAWVTALHRTIEPAPTSAPSLSAPSSSSNGSYTVSWGTVTHAETYTLQQQVNGGSWSTVQSGSSQSKSFSGKADGSYGYRVRGCNSDSGCGPWSGTKTVTVAQPPGVPTGLSVSVSGPSYKPVVAVSWNATSGASSYQVEQTLPDGTTTVSSATTTSYSQIVYATGQVEYRVKACNGAGCSGWSAGKYVFLQSGSGGGKGGGGVPLAEPATAPAPSSSTGGGA